MAKSKRTQSATVVAVDTETTGLNVWGGARPFAISACFADGTTKYIEWDVDPTTRAVKYRRDAAWDEWQELLGDPKIEKAFWNAKFDIRMLQAAGFTIRGRIHETMFMAHTANPLEDSFQLKVVAEKYADIHVDDQDELKKVVKGCRLFAKRYLKWPINKGDVDADYWLPAAVRQTKLGREYLKKKGWTGKECRKYAVLDAVRTLALFNGYSQILREQDTWDTYEFEMEVWPVVMNMEARGVAINESRIRKESKECHKIIREATRATKGINLNPSKELREYLFSQKDGGLGLKPIKSTKSGPSVDKESLGYYRDHPIVAKILSAGRARKLLGTYFSAYRLLAVEDSQGNLIIHPNFRQLGPKTGRFSCTDPNLQNVPKRGVAGDIMTRARSAFGPRKGYVLYAIDYSQIEARLFAEEAGEESMLRIFRKGGDIYQFLADEIAKLTKIVVTRDQAKTLFLAWQYGMGITKLMIQLRCSEEDAMSILEAAAERFPNVSSFMRDSMTQAKREGMIRTRFGRRTFVPSGKEYVAVNYKIQGAAADLMKRALLRVEALCQKWRDAGKDVHLLLTVHDEILIEFKKGTDSRIRLQKVCNAMSGASKGFYTVPTPVEISRIRSSWSDKEEMRLAA